MVSDDDSIQSVGYSLRFERPDVDWEHVLLLAVGGGTIGLPLVLHEGVTAGQLVYLIAVFPISYALLILFFAFNSS